MYTAKGQIIHTITGGSFPTVKIFIGSADMLPGDDRIFGGLNLPGDLLDAFIQEVCQTFGVSHIDALVGSPCIGYRCFPTVICDTKFEGLESINTGKRMTLTGFRQRHCGLPKDYSVLGYEMDLLQIDIHRLQDEIARQTKRLTELPKVFTTVEEK